MMNKTLLFLTCFVSFCVLPQVSQAEPIFGTPTLQPEVFSPNGDFVQDITSIEYDVVVDSAQVQISLTPVGGGSTIATLQALVTRGQGIHVFAFDGRVDDVVLDDGDYEIALFGIGTQGEGDELVTLPLTIDTEAPTFLAIDTIEPANAVVANGTAVVLDVCIEGSPTSVTADFSSLDSGFDNANVQVTPLDQTCFRIEYTISAANNRIDAAGLPVLLSAIDAGGNRAASETAYCLSNSPPEILSTNLLNEFSIFQNGDRIEVEVEFSSIALTVDVDADFSALDTQFNPAAVTEQSLSATRSRLTYVISEANTQIDGEYPIVVTVKDPGCGVAEDSSLSASLDNAGDFAAVIGDVFFALSEGARSDTTQYSPKNLDGIKDDVTVAFSALEDTVLVTISAELKPPGFSVPQLVTILDQQEFLAGDYTFTWDGLSADGVIDARDLADQVIGIFVFGVSTDFDRRRNRRLELVLDNTPPQLESFIAPTDGIQNGDQI
ncbi:MAG: hypothetical protein HKN21_11350, partial [Candidatus Eisenbacteria bacterium]|nr:hypothetical protein [Candidatus Eisenbacteria bacterium]